VCKAIFPDRRERQAAAICCAQKAEFTLASHLSLEEVRSLIGSRAEVSVIVGNGGISGCGDIVLTSVRVEFSRETTQRDPAAELDLSAIALADESAVER